MRIGLILLLLLPFAATASLFPPAQITSWRPGIDVGVIGGITNRTVIGANAKTGFGAVGDGVHDDTTNIANAFGACAAGTVLYIPTGTYRLNSRINFTGNNVTIRGDGMGKTVLVTYSGNYIYCGNGDWPLPSPSINVMYGATNGSTTLVCSNVTGLAVGSLMTLTQTNPPYVHPNTNYYGGGPSDSGHPGDTTRLMAITVKVAGIAGTNVTLEHALPIDMTNNPMITPWQNMVQGMGFEDFTLNMTNGGGGAGIFFNQAYGCWVKGVEVAGATSRFLWFDTAVNCEVRECYTHDAVGGGPNHEGIDLFQNCDYFLVEDNVCVRAGFPMIMLGDWGGGCVGNAVNYNYLADAESGSSVAGWAISDNHGPHNMFNLIEGNVAQNYCADGYYGSSSHGTLFRNYFSGAFSTNTFDWPFAISLCHWSDYYNLVGNVVGTNNFLANYTETNNGYGVAEAVLFRLGYPNAGNSSYVLQSLNTNYYNDFDLNVKLTANWTGNYDYTNGATIWDTNGVQTLPNSLAYTNQPSWWTNWGSTPWPPIGSDLTPLVSTLPAQLWLAGNTNTPPPPSGIPVGWLRPPK